MKERLGSNLRRGIKRENCRFVQIVCNPKTRFLSFSGEISRHKPEDARMADISLSSNTRAALNASEGVSVTALKIAAQSEQAIVALVEQVAETAKAAAPQGQGQNVDRLV
jgi:hypothetical protein